MTRQVLFIHGAGEGAYKEDLLLAQKLQNELGEDYTVSCPEMPDEANAPYDLWKQQIEKEIREAQKPIILVGHSMGASHLAKVMTEIDVHKAAGIFLLEAPFWGGEGWLYEGYEELEIAKESVAKLSEDVRIFIYHTRDDEVVPFSHLALYANLLPQATIRELGAGGHQMDNALPPVAEDIRSLE